MSLVSLNGSGVQVSNPQLYQSIRDLIDQFNALQILFNSLGLSVTGNELDASISAPLSLLGGQLKFPIVQNPSNNINTLDDYKEGLWSPVDASGAALVLTSLLPAIYTKIGRLVIATAGIQYPATGSGANALLGGLPFIASPSGGVASISFQNSGININGQVPINTSTIRFLTNVGVVVTNSQLSNSVLIFVGIYSV